MRNGYAPPPPDPDTCPGHETDPNTCRCACDGCKYHCSAHFRPPPAGWFMFGTHAYPGAPKVEFSEEVGPEDGLPLWERPIADQPTGDRP